ncbi:hypothetical protein HGRIS_005206 [Hohenbuehelia grisea]|uniref:Hydrophobin n=1 Tax=Hohenbuehelia grisea TaxID=104357 RepID=A0ABR3JEI8_9AGAR
MQFSRLLSTIVTVLVASWAVAAVDCTCTPSGFDVPLTPIFDQLSTSAGASSATVAGQQVVFAALLALVRPFVRPGGTVRLNTTPCALSGGSCGLNGCSTCPAPGPAI